MQNAMVTWIFEEAKNHQDLMRVHLRNYFCFLALLKAYWPSLELRFMRNQLFSMSLHKWPPFTLFWTGGRSMCQRLIISYLRCYAIRQRFSVIISHIKNGNGLFYTSVQYDRETQTDSASMHLPSSGKLTFTMITSGPSQQVIRRGPLHGRDSLHCFPVHLMGNAPTSMSAVFTLLSYRFL